MTDMMACDAVRFDVIRRGGKLQELMVVPEEPGWWYAGGITFQIGPTECAVTASRLATGIRTVDFGMGWDMAVLDRLEGPVRGITPMRRTAFERHPRTSKPVQMSRWSPRGGFIPLGARRADGTPHPHAGTGFGLSTVLAFPCDEQGNLTTRMYSDTDDVYISHELLQFSYDGRTFAVDHAERAEPQSFLEGCLVLGCGLDAAIPDGDDLLFGATIKGDKPENMQCGLARWRRIDGRWRMSELVPVATEPGVYYSEPTCARDQDGSLLFCARANRRHSIQVWRSTDGGRGWTLLFTQDNMRPLTPITINTTGDGRAYVAANPFCPGDLDSRGIKRYANALREKITLWPLSEDRRRLLDPVVFRDGPADFGIPPSGSIWAIDHPCGRTVRMADGQWHHVVGYRLLDLAEILDKAPPTPVTGCYMDEIALNGAFTPPWRF